MNELEKELCKAYQKKYAIYTGNGTTAMYLAFLALNKQDKKVLFPAITCTNPVNAAIAAGFKVDFCDVNLQDYTMDLDSLECELSTKEYGVVVPTHIYGHFCNMKAIDEICKKYNVSILEDAAQTTKLLGGDISITSFGHTKIFQTNYGGGVAFTDDEDLYNKMNSYKQGLPLKPNNSEDIFDDYREKYYKIVHSNLSDKDKNDKMKKLQLDSAKLFLFHSEDNLEILEVLNNRVDIINARIAKQRLYLKQLSSKDIKLCDEFTYLQNPLWRFSFLYLNDREELLKRVRALNIDISSWYPSVATIYKGKHLKNADVVAKSIINLWVSNDHSEEQIIKEIEQINICMEDIYERK